MFSWKLFSDSEGRSSKEKSVDKVTLGTVFLSQRRDYMRGGSPSGSGGDVASNVLWLWSANQGLWNCPGSPRVM